MCLMSIEGLGAIEGRRQEEKFRFAWPLISLLCGKGVRSCHFIMVENAQLEEPFRQLQWKKFLLRQALRAIVQAIFL